MTVKQLATGAYGNWIDALTNTNRRWDDGAVQTPRVGWIGWGAQVFDQVVGRDGGPKLEDEPKASEQQVAARVRAHLIQGLAKLAAPDLAGDFPKVAFGPEHRSEIRRTLTAVAEQLGRAGVAELAGERPFEALATLPHAILERALERLGSAAGSTIAPAVALMSSMDAQTVRDPEAFALDKLAELVGNARRTGAATIELSSIREGVHRATLGVDSGALKRLGIDIALEDAIVPPRKIFYRTLSPLAKPSGKVVILPPGYSETGSNMLKQAEELRKDGHFVVCPDMKFDGFGETTSGRFESLVHVARDIAEIARAEGGRVLREELAGHPEAEIILSGNSTTGGGSILAAQLLKAGAFRGELEDPPLGRVRVAVASPYLAPSERFQAQLVSKLAHARPLRLVTSAPLPPGSPLLPMHHDPATNQEMAQVSRTEGHHSAIGAFADFDTGLALSRALAEKGFYPAAVTAHIDARDKVASAPALREFIEAAGRAGSFGYLQVHRRRRRPLGGAERRRGPRAARADRRPPAPAHAPRLILVASSGCPPSTLRF